MLSLNSFYVYIEERIFISFENDETNINNSYLKKVSFLNIFGIFVSIIIFIFVIIFIFISIAKFTEPIKEGASRMNYSFYYIKQYSLLDYRKNENN